MENQEKVQSNLNVDCLGFVNNLLSTPYKPTIRLHKQKLSPLLINWIKDAKKSINQKK